MDSTKVYAIFLQPSSLSQDCHIVKCWRRPIKNDRSLPQYLLGCKFAVLGCGVSLPRHGTGCKLEGWIEPSRKVVVFDLLGLVLLLVGGSNQV